MNTLERILGISKENNLNQASLAENLSKMVSFKITKQTITDWKGGKSNSYYFCIPEIAKLLNVSCDYLLTGHERNTTLTEREEKLLKWYRESNEAGQNYILMTSEMVADKYKKGNSVPNMENFAG